MRAYILPYRVLFHDTMAYGTHHFLTNLKFQCLAREHLFFSSVVEGTAHGRALHDDSIFLTRDAYSLNLAPVPVGGRVAILLTTESASLMSVRFCFRVVSERGEPVCAGYQTIVAIDRATQALVEGPAWLRAVGSQIEEPLREPDFLTRLHGARVGELFSPAVLALAARALASPDAHIDGMILGDQAEVGTPATAAAPLEGPLPRAFLFPGQGSADRRALADLLASGPTAAEALRAADEVTRGMLGASLLEAIRSEQSSLDPDTLADLTQVGMVMLGALAAPELAARAGEPSVMMGHSLGEISALIASGALSPADGAVVVCHRVRVLRALGPGVGGMLALLGPADRAEQLVASLAPAPVWVAVRNHDEQIVASGAFPALEQLERAAAAAGLQTRRLASPLPFHCPLLAPAVQPFATALAGMRLGPAKTPVYSPLAGRMLDPEREDLPSLLASHLTTPLDWPTAVRALWAAGARELLETGSGILRGLVRRILGPEAVVSPPERAAPPPPPPEPIALVAMGCVLPTARDPDDLWAAILEGRSGISDAGDADPALRADFLTPGPPTPDRTYTLLGGFIRDFAPVAEPAAADPDLSEVQRYLWEAIAQCTRSLPESDGRTLVLVGSTADGSLDHDDALLRDGLLSSKVGARLAEPLTGALGQRSSARSAPYPAAAEIVRRALGARAELMLVDAACASSLYAIDLGVRALRQRWYDRAFCGGVFAPGAANSCLFSQFGGLSAHGSRPLDRDADGVVFGDGAAMLALMRLSDVRDEQVLAVIRETGTSSDGKGPSVALPRSEGQALAMRRAWGRAELAPADADYVEAHATSTPVGDSVEFSAIKQCFGPNRARPLALGSVKALTGHTGWAAGAVSVVKVVSALTARTLPPQARYKAPNARIDLSGGFEILANPAPWPERSQGSPRLAGVSGFGFGGSNAHVVLASPAASPPAPAAPARRLTGLVVVGWSASLSEAAAASGPERRLGEAGLALPAGRLILPDVLEDMDRSQRLAVHLAAGALPQGWERIRSEIGVVFGLEGKTERSIRLAKRLHRHRVARLLRARDADPAEIERLVAEAETERVSGPYTLPGLMPNVAAGRVSNFFDLQGPNVVVDAGRASLGRAVELAAWQLADGSCRLVLAGALAPVVLPELEEPGAPPLAEAGLVLALADPAGALAEGWPVLARLELGAGGQAVQDPALLRGAHGATALLAALEAAGHGAASGWLGWEGLGLRVLPPTGAPDGPQPEDQPPLPEIHRATATWEAIPSPPPAALPSRPLLLVEGVPPLDGVDALAPGPLDGARAVDLSTDETARASLAGVDWSAYDAILAVRRAGSDEAPTRDPLAELLLVVAREAWPRLSGGHLSLGVLTLGAVDAEGRPHPASGPLVGLIKSLTRDLPKVAVRAVTTDATDPHLGLDQLARALASAEAPAETLWRADQPGTLVPTALLHLSKPGDPLVRPGDVVLATGGARGVTAALIEALQERVGCRVILLGRSVPEAVPDALVAQDDETFASEERAFYQREMARDPAARLPELRRAFQRLGAAREAARTLALLSALPGEVRYCAADLSDAAALTEALAPLLAEWGPPRLIIHGAGVQRSGALTRKRLEDFRGAMDTKVAGLAHLLDAVRASAPDAKPAVHLLGSVFSFLGNDGQHGYGAANETLARLAGWQAAAGAPWSSIAWPGWASLGMTRGSEYAALAQARELRPLKKEEGQRLFLEMLSGPPVAPCVLLLSEGELRWSGARLRPALLASRSRDPDAFPHAHDHVVTGRVTLAGSFDLELCVRSALEAHPGWQLAELRDLAWERFVRLDEREPLRILAVPVTLAEDRRELDLLLVSDFVHASGRVLQRDVLHFRARATLSKSAPQTPAIPSAAHLAWSGGIAVPDPYTRPEGPLGLRGAFQSTVDLHIHHQGQSGRFLAHSPEPPPDHCLPPMLVDAACRLAMLGPGVEHAADVFVPFRCARLWVASGLRVEAEPSGPAVLLRAARPARDGLDQHTPWALAFDAQGQPLLWAEGLHGRLASLPAASGSAQVAEKEQDT